MVSMTQTFVKENYNDAPETAATPVKRGVADSFKGGVIMDVVTPEQARIAEA